MPKHSENQRRTRLALITALIEQQGDMGKKALYQILPVKLAYRQFVRDLTALGVEESTFGIVRVTKYDEDWGQQLRYIRSILPEKVEHWAQLRFLKPMLDGESGERPPNWYRIKKGLDKKPKKMIKKK